MTDKTWRTNISQIIGKQICLINSKIHFFLNFLRETLSGCGIKIRIIGGPVVYQLIYTSSATPALDDFTLREIAQTSNYNNQKLGITGLLLFHEGSILQVLEGDEMSVSALYSKVEQDPRHIGCMVLSTRHAEKREFENWFMGYKNISNNLSGKNLFSLTRENLATVMPRAPSPELSALTRSYAKVSGF